jgi:hypothetical protein
MPDNKTVYAHHGNEYEALIKREDYQGNILPLLRRSRPGKPRRLDLRLGPDAWLVQRFRLSPTSMPLILFRICCALSPKTDRSRLTNWEVNIADHRQLPLDDHSADLVVSGWA